MTRIKGGKLHAKRRRNILKHTKGFKWGRKNKIKLAKIADKKAGQYAYDDRKVKKRLNRGRWLIQINAAVREYGLNYNKFINLLKKKNSNLNRKILAEIANKNPLIFQKIVETVK